ncbi:phosphatidate cytidylyltransferase [Wenyingzhuangia sp. 2_MG-2023]|uniref:phosphatidate cytidylyltransferase n=1 Tax=Wenyingzhuangia sp. 2_MG-2023 TaxID=3062639 RepID=UPI0026E18FB7|nr:phosphatidate cytidylyltransferase [Wenyingzhuangia sp. 2_MG-2023]MDO6737824.1 phosphatidate cytidylyltransferase [Wenyingzhuangia sp. 2_MG-2023]
MLQRAFSGIIFISILIGATLFNSLTFYLLFFFFMLVAIFEFQKLSKYKTPFFYVLGVISFILSAGGIQILKSNFEVTNIISNNIINTSFIYVILFASFLIVLFKRVNNSPFLDLGIVFLTYLYAIVPFTIILAIPFCNEAHIYEGTTFLGCIILIWSTDTFAYLTGKAIGKHKLYPKISPNKTIEGSVGGLFFTLITASILSYYFTQYSLPEWIGLSIVISIFGGLGDLVESMFKRAANIKDSGNLIPGHGGVLDRFDSLLFASPFIYFYLQLIS